jgi:DNA end-binding protein Ku
MAPQALWSGSLRLSLVLIPVKLYPAVSTEDAVSFRMIHKPSGKPIRYLKGIETDRGFKEVPEDEIIKGYEHTKGHYVLVKPEELDALKLEAKHTINLERFVDRASLDSRYFEKPYYLLPDGDEADEGYVIMREALAKTGKVAIGQLIMQGHEHLVGIAALGKGLTLEILRYAYELRNPEPYFEKVTAELKPDAVAMAAELIKRQAGKFEPKKMPNEYAKAVKELVRAKVEHRAPEIEIADESGRPPKVINIMAALKESMQAKGRAKVRDAVRKRMGKEPPAEKPVRASRGDRASTGSRRSVH